MLRSPLFLLSVAVTLVGFVLHLIALRNMPLFLAQSGVGASLAVTALLAMWIFHDQLSTRDWTRHCSRLRRARDDGGRAG